MVDKEKRLKAAALIEDFVSGRVTNYEYDDRFPITDPEPHKDPALHAIYTMLWFSYSDVREHRFDVGKLNEEEKETLQRCLLFLRSDFDYTSIPSFIDLFGIFKRVWYWMKRRPEPTLSPVWPFENAEQLRSARQSAGTER